MANYACVGLLGYRNPTADILYITDTSVKTYLLTKMKEEKMGFGRESSGNNQYTWCEYKKRLLNQKTV